MNTSITIKCDDHDLCEKKAREIFDFLGRDFFTHRYQTREQTALSWEVVDREVVQWISDILRFDSLVVEFDDSKDALLFKLVFGGL